MEPEEFEEQFREDYPEFAHTSPEIYESEVIQFHYKMGKRQMTKRRWGDLWLDGIELYVAHNVVIQTENIKAVANGQQPVQSVNVISQQSAGPVSVSVDSQLVGEQDAGYYNLTTYGTKFWKMLEVVGAGGYAT